MKLSKYEKLKQKFDVLKLEKNFSPLNTTLYWFSLLGNAFLIYFGYFFIKTITNTLPELFPYQDAFFTVFIALFLTGYEFTKRFVIEQTAVGIVSTKRLTSGALIGIATSLCLILGSFYLSVNGAHRLVDSTEKITVSLDTKSSIQIDSIGKYYDKEIAYYRAQPAKTRVDRNYRDSVVSDLQSKKEDKLKAIEGKLSDKSTVVMDKNKENDTAFFFMTFFLEIIIILGVAFNAYYTIGSYQETTKLLQTPKYKQYVLHIKLLKIYYNNGKKNLGDIALPVSKLMSIAKLQKLQVSGGEVNDFINLCGELGIVETAKNKRKQYSMVFEDALRLMEKDDSL